MDRQQRSGQQMSRVINTESFGSPYFQGNQGIREMKAWAVEWLWRTAISSCGAPACGPSWP